MIMKDKKIKQLEKGIKDLQEQLDKLKNKPKFKVGKWYKSTNCLKALFCVTHLNGREIHFYGRSVYGEWTNDDWVCDTYFNEDCAPATDKEVEEGLIKEAKKRGLLDNMNVKFFNSYPENGLYIQGVKNGKLWSKNGVVFSKGKWAEIIENKVVINGYEMKQEGDIISFGCAKLHKGWFVSMMPEINRLNERYRNSTNRKIKSITLDSGVEITVKELKQIVDNIK